MNLICYLPEQGLVFGHLKSYGNIMKTCKWLSPKGTSLGNKNNLKAHIPVPYISDTKDREHSDRTNSTLQEEIKISIKGLALSIDLNELDSS